jgi:deoxyuridine 5'-triphosphate nucleotidohydrolase (EC 3.6.1.23)
LKIKIQNHSNNPLPAYASAGSSGLDIRANLTTPIILAPLQRVLVPTGLFLEIPNGFEAQIRPRSGMAIKHGITCLNTPGTIDSDYRGEIKVILINLSYEPYTILHGDRIAQIVFAPIQKIEWFESEHLNHSQRQQGGFGSTGLH